MPGLDRLYDAYSFNVIPRLGRLVTGDAELLPLSRRDRSASSRARQAFAGMIEAAGFRRVTHRLLTGGVVALHSGWKL